MHQGLTLQWREKMQTVAIDVETARAAEVLLYRLAGRHAVSESILFGGRARQTRRPDSDMNIEVAVQGVGNTLSGLTAVA